MEKKLKIDSNTYYYCNWTRTRNQLNRKGTLNDLAKLDIQATIECGLTLKCGCDMTRTYSHVTTPNRQTTFCLTRLQMTLKIT